jgi:hypothetical protein
VGGLAPLIVEQDLQARFLIPMALSLAAGVAFATLLTLVLAPSLLVILNDLRRLWVRLRHGQWLPPEAVEPARTRRTEGMYDVDGKGVDAEAAVFPMARPGEALPKTGTG